MCAAETRTTSDRFVSGHNEVLTGSIAQVKDSWKILKAIRDSTSDDIAQLRKGLDAERKSNPDLNYAWEQAIPQYQMARAKHGDQAWAKVKCPEEYHIALVAYIMESPFYSKFNKATRTATMATVKNYPYKNYFKLLLLDIENVPGQPHNLGNEVLYRGMNGKMKFVIDEYGCFQHFTSTSKERSVAERFIADKKSGTLFVITDLEDTSKRQFGDIMPFIIRIASCVDHFNTFDEKEVVIEPGEAFKIMNVKTEENGLQVVYLRAEVS